VQGDGEDVAALVDRLKPHSLFLDFDRTVCSTKAGGSPLQGGSHSVDPDLLALLCAPASSGMDVHIVTRNSHKDDIETFLSSRGVNCLMTTACEMAAPRVQSSSCTAQQVLSGPEEAAAGGVSVAGQVAVRVHSAKLLGVNKSDIMLGCDGVARGRPATVGLLPPGAIGIFVDDDVREHVVPEIASCQTLHRVLFVRSK
jgi:hypothetical protein